MISSRSRFLSGLIGYVKMYHPDIAAHLTKQHQPGHIVLPGQSFMPPAAVDRIPMDRDAGTPSF